MPLFTQERIEPLRAEFEQNCASVYEAIFSLNNKKVKPWTYSSFAAKINGEAEQQNKSLRTAGMTQLNLRAQNLARKFALQNNS